MTSTASICAAKPTAALSNQVHAVEFTLPCSDDELDALIGNERFQEIKSIEVMEDFLVAAARRYHAMNAEIRKLIDDDDYDCWFENKRKAWAKLESMFVDPHSFLLAFFSETDGYYDRPYQERKRMIGFAAALVECGRDASKIDWAVQAYGRASAVSAEG